MLLCGYSPFKAIEQQALVEETIRGKIEFEEAYWEKPSEECESDSLVSPSFRLSVFVPRSSSLIRHHSPSTAKEFIKSLLQTDPTKRPTASAALQHHVRALLLASSIVSFRKLLAHPSIAPSLSLSPQWLTSHSAAELDIGEGLRQTFSRRPERQTTAQVRRVDILFLSLFLLY